MSNQIDEKTPHVDPLLVNAWGLTRSATSGWWVSDNLSGWATIYTATGVVEGLKALIPTAGNGPSSPTGLNGPGMPSGIVFNGSPEFMVKGTPSNFIFATLDGTISAWAFGANKNEAIIKVDNSADKAMYTGLAITSNPSGPNFLYAADNTNNHVDMFDDSFHLVKSFGDASIPSNFSVFGIQDINGLVYVTYAIPNVGAGGFIDVFREDGTLVKTLIKGLPLNQAWGMAAAPSNFGPLSNTLLVSNNSQAGTINAFNITTGMFVGTMKDQNGKAIVYNNLWGVAFGGGNASSGPANVLYVTAGPGPATASQMSGIFAAISFNPICK